MMFTSRKVTILIWIIVLLGVAIYLAMKPASVDDSDGWWWNDTAGEQKMPKKFEGPEEKWSDTTKGVSTYVLWSWGLIGIKGDKGTVSYRGVMPLKEASFTTISGRVQSGKMVIDLAALRMTGTWAEIKELEEQFKNNVFQIGTYPEATLLITSVNPNAEESIVQGDLTINGVTETITFMARVGLTDDQLNIVGDAFIDTALRKIDVSKAAIDELIGLMINVHLKKQ